MMSELCPASSKRDPTTQSSNRTTLRPKSTPCTFLVRQHTERMARPTRAPTIEHAKRSLVHGLALGICVLSGLGCSFMDIRNWREELSYVEDRDFEDHWCKHTPPWAIPLIREASYETQIYPGLLVALIHTESAWQTEAISKAGAIGLTQLMPTTAKALGVDPWDPRENVLGGARYLREQLDYFQSVRLALAAYNAGPYQVRRYRGVPPFKETRSFISTVMRLMDTFSSDSRDISAWETSALIKSVRFDRSDWDRQPRSPLCFRECLRPPSTEQQPRESRYCRHSPPPTSISSVECSVFQMDTWEVSSASRSGPISFSRPAMRYSLPSALRPL